VGLKTVGLETMPVAELKIMPVRVEGLPITLRTITTMFRVRMPECRQTAFPKAIMEPTHPRKTMVSIRSTEIPQTAEIVL
jgi:hypothetical protein